MKLESEENKCTDGGGKSDKVRGHLKAKHHSLPGNLEITHSKDFKKKRFLPPLLSDPVLLHQVLEPRRRGQTGGQVQSEGCSSNIAIHMKN